MFKTGIVFIALLLFMPAGNLSMAQELKTDKDTAIVAVQQNKEEDEATAESGQGEKTDKDSKSSSQGENKKATKVKEVKSGRPDMSKSKGARPPSVVRPSGSKIPAGAGRPKGAGKGRVR